MEKRCTLLINIISNINILSALLQIHAIFWISKIYIHSKWKLILSKAYKPKRSILLIAWPSCQGLHDCIQKNFQEQRHKTVSARCDFRIGSKPVHDIVDSNKPWHRFIYVMCRKLLEPMTWEIDRKSYGRKSYDYEA